MDFRLLTFRLLLNVGAVFAVVLSSAAQEAAAPSTQPILFSSPADDSPAMAMPAPALDASGFANAVQIPSVGFKFKAPNFSAPPPPLPVISPARSQQLQDLIERRKNWALETPAEILGVTTPESILQLPERNPTDRRNSLTPSERYAEMNDGTDRFRTNAFLFRNPSSPWAIPGNAGVPSNPDAFGPVAGERENGPQPFMNGLFKATAFKKSLSGNVDATGDWPKSFDAPAPVSTAPSPAQQQAMDQFRQLLEATSPAAPSPASHGLFKAQTSDSIFRPAAAGSFNGSISSPGSRLTPLTSLPVLPSVSAQSETPPAPAPSWAPQPPPWMSQTPQPFVIPQRKF